MITAAVICIFIAVGSASPVLYHSLKKYQQDDPIIIHSIEEIPDFVEQHHNIPLVAIFFVDQLEDSKEAVAKTIEDHRLTGDPIVVWKDGKVVKVHPEKLQARETKTEYTVKKRKKQ